MTFKKCERTNLTKIGGEETIDEWVGRGVEGGEGLDEGGHRGGGGDQVVHLQRQSSVSKMKNMNITKIKSTSIGIRA